VEATALHAAASQAPSEASSREVGVADGANDRHREKADDEERKQRRDAHAPAGVTRETDVPVREQGHDGDQKTFRVSLVTVATRKATSSRKTSL
jgi:hypothetical protein